MRDVEEPTLEQIDGATVLVADDDPDIRELVALRLRAAGFDVQLAANGEEALAMVAVRRPDLLVLDVAMPLVDGLEVCRRVQELGTDAPPVIFLTARAHPAGLLEGFEAGAADYVTKPFRPAELMARVQAALRAKAIRDAYAREATTDPLTGVLNRRGLDGRVAEVVGLARRYARPLACLMIDIDHFKRINDTYGHPAGDEVLRVLAERLRQHTRVSDVVARYGGEEFTVLLPETDEEHAVAAAEKVRREIAAAPVVVEFETGPASIDLRASVGVASWNETMVGPAELFGAADQALYEAKRLGRDRVVVASQLAAA
jgi:diguanylate cyclase (GGDEF)-like protein